MNHLWSGGDGEAKAVHAALGKRRGITLNTIQSTLKLLVKRRWERMTIWTPKRVAELERAAAAGSAKQ